MKPQPTAGYDILIWAEDDGRVFSLAQTILGEAILHGLKPKYKRGTMLELKIEPEVFFAGVPRKSKIGLISPSTHEVQLVALGGLH